MRKCFFRYRKLGLFLALVTLLVFLPSCNQNNVDLESHTDNPSLCEVGLTGTSPEVSAKAAIGIEASGGEIFYAKNIDQRLPMASTTKIMTAIVALEVGDMTDKVTIDKRAVGIEGSSIYLYEGEILTLGELLYATLLSSANDAATAVAIHIGGDVDTFVDMMNNKAIELGLRDTHFENPHGLDNDTHYTTARELGIIAMYAMKNPAFREIVSTYKETIPMRCGEGVRLLINHNKLLTRYEGACGVKTGFTDESGRCLVGAAERNGVRVIAVTLDCPNDWREHTALLQMGLSAFQYTALAQKRSIAFRLPVLNGSEDTVLLSNPRDIYAVLPNDADIETRFDTVQYLTAPIKKGAVLGSVSFYINNKLIAESPLTAEASISTPQKPKRFFFF